MYHGFWKLWVFLDEDNPHSPINQSIWIQCSSDSRRQHIAMLNFAEKLCWISAVSVGFVFLCFAQPPSLVHLLRGPVCIPGLRFAHCTRWLEKYPHLCALDSIAFVFENMSFVAATPHLKNTSMIHVGLLMMISPEWNPMWLKSRSSCCSKTFGLYHHNFGWSNPSLWYLNPKSNWESEFNALC